MAISRVNISQEISDWQNAVYGEEVRSANVSALTKLQTQMNDACDAIEEAVDDVTDAVSTATSASATANAASSTAQSAITQAQTAIAQAQGYAGDAAQSATDAANTVTQAAAYAQDASNYAASANAAKSAAETARDQAIQIAGMSPDGISLTQNEDGVLSAITLTLEEIEMATDPVLLGKQLPSAKAVNQLNSDLMDLVAYVDVPFGGRTLSGMSSAYATGVYDTTRYNILSAKIISSDVNEGFFLVNATKNGGSAFVIVFNVFSEAITTASDCVIRVYLTKK